MSGRPIEKAPLAGLFLWRRRNLPRHFIELKNSSFELVFFILLRRSPRTFSCTWIVPGKWHAWRK
jgi:hypothetical protein